MSWPSVPVLGIVVAILGLACYVLPPLLFPDTNPEKIYGHPLIPWFAMAYGRFRLWPTMCPLFVVGAFAGAVQPRVGCCWVFLRFHCRPSSTLSM